MSPRFLPFGDTGVLVDLGAEPDPLDVALAWHADLSEHPVPGQTEVLAAAETVLLRCADPRSAARALTLLSGRRPDGRDARHGRLVTIETVYSGEDLDVVAALTGLSPEAVVAAHSGRGWTAAFGGFAPGFSYLTGGEPRLAVPRRDSPRTAVPAGAVALAGAFSAVYPRESPGGWQLIGHTATPMWDLSREQPALLAPGDTVRFDPVREQVRARPAPAGVPDDVNHSRAVLTVVSPGLHTTFQDGGRPGRGDLGVTASGAADRPSARQANRLVGLPEDAPVLETLLGGLSLEAETTVVIALAGAVGEATIDGDDRTLTAPVCAPFALYPGQTLTLGVPEAGLRGYVAVRVPGEDGLGSVGVLDAESVLGSRSTDTLSGLGPAPLAAGDRLIATPPAQAGSGARRATAVGHAEASATPLPAPGETVTLRVTRGPRADWFEGETRALTRIEWTVSARTDRVGARLQTDGTPLTRARHGELASEGMVPGALQVPPDGNPVIFLADHPVTGGYPVIATVVDADLSLAAQLPPGTPVRFQLVTSEECS